MSEIALSRQRTIRRGLGYYLRVLRVIGVIEFKTKYAGALLGYVWSLAKPLAYFGVLWLVFAHLLRTANSTRQFTVFLLLGVLLYSFFVDVVSYILPSIVERGSLLRRMAFPPILIPLSVSVSVCITFCVNMLAIVVFIALGKISPSPEWLLVIPLLLELYVLALGLGLLFATLFVRFRDIGQVWEIGSQVLFFASAIMYPVGILPPWAQKVCFLNPFVQVLQDMRHVILGGSKGPYDTTAGAVFAHAGGRLLPIVVALAVFGAGLILFRRDGRHFAERI
jgi:ABC-2 type transport system permease protein